MQMKTLQIHKSFLLWSLIFLISLSGFYFFGDKPGWVLWVEEYQPSTAYERGKVKLKKGDKREALELFRSGQQYFYKLYSDTGLEKMKIYWLTGVLLEANLLKSFTGEQDINTALMKYEQIKDQAPYLSDGQACVSLGELYTRKSEFKKAIEAYAKAIDFGCETYRIESLYGRGYGFLEEKKFAEAAKDWRLYARYAQKPLPQWISQQMHEFPDGFDIAGTYVRAIGAFSLGKKEDAKARFSEYNRQYPSDRGSKYYCNILNGDEYKPEYGAISFDTIFPSSMEAILRASEIWIDLYSGSESEIIFSLEMANRPGYSGHSIVVLINNGVIMQEWSVDHPDFLAYSSAMKLKKGKNILELRIKKEQDNWKRDSIQFRSLYWASGKT